MFRVCLKLGRSWLLSLLRRRCLQNPVCCLRRILPSPPVFVPGPLEPGLFIPGFNYTVGSRVSRFRVLGFSRFRGSRVLVSLVSGSPCSGFRLSVFSSLVSWFRFPSPASGVPKMVSVLGPHQVFRFPVFHKGFRSRCSPQGSGSGWVPKKGSGLPTRVRFRVPTGPCPGPNKVPFGFPTRSGAQQGPNPTKVRSGSHKGSGPNKVQVPTRSGSPKPSPHKVRSVPSGPNKVRVPQVPVGSEEVLPGTRPWPGNHRFPVQVNFPAQKLPISRLSNTLGHGRLAQESGLRASGLPTPQMHASAYGSLQVASVCRCKP